MDVLKHFSIKTSSGSRTGLRKAKQLLQQWVPSGVERPLRPAQVHLGNFLHSFRTKRTFNFREICLTPLMSKCDVILLRRPKIPCGRIQGCFKRMTWRFFFPPFFNYERLLYGIRAVELTDRIHVSSSIYFNFIWSTSGVNCHLLTT